MNLLFQPNIDPVGMGIGWAGVLKSSLKDVGARIPFSLHLPSFKVENHFISYRSHFHLLLPRDALLICDICKLQNTENTIFFFLLLVD